MERQSDVTSPTISGFHHSLVAENYNFLRGVYACELRQHDVKKRFHETMSKVFSGDILYIEESQVMNLPEGLYIFEKRTNHITYEKADDCLRYINFLNNFSFLI